MGEPDFNDLLHAAEQLECEAQGIGRLPRIERSLRQLAEASNELWSKVTSTGAQDIQANLLLGSKGVDLPQLSQKLDSLSTRKTFEPLEPIPDNDIQNFLKNETENAVLSLIENTHRFTSKQLEHNCQKEMFYSWENEKRKLLNSFMGHSISVVELPVSHEYTTINESRLSHSPMDQYEMAYAQALIEHNTALLSGELTPNLVDKFAAAVSPFNDTKVNDMWDMMKYMCDLSASPLSSQESFPRATPLIQGEMIAQARKYLENRYQVFMNNKLSQCLAEVRRGVPGTYSLVTAFLQVQISAGAISSLGLDELLVDNLPYWVLVYYLLRCGDVDSAITATKTLGPGMNEMYRVLVDLKENCGRVSSKMERVLKNQYKPYVRNSSDPYKRLVYSALGACSIGDEHSEVILTADDYLWLKLLQVRPSPEGIVLRDSHAAIAADVLSYEVLQMMVIDEYGESYYEASTNPSLYFQMLLLTGQYEAAVEFLVRTPRLRCHGVHMAIALLKTGHLAVTGSSEAPLLCIESDDPPPARRLNPARLVTLYTNRFETSAPREALHYYFTLRHLQASGPGGHNMFASCVAGLALATRDFAGLFGSLDRPDGCVGPGLMHEFGHREADLRAVVLYTAECSENKGEFSDAIQLYELGGNQERALCLMCTCLAQVVARPGELGDSPRARLQAQACAMLERMTSQPVGADPQTVRTFHVLVDLCQFFDAFADGQYGAALDMIQRSELIPLSLTQVEEKVLKFKKLDERITRNIADILFATMTMIHSEFKKFKEENTLPGLSTDEANKKRHFLKERARALTSFSCSIPFRIPGDINRKLVQMETHMD